METWRRRLQKTRHDTLPLVDHISDTSDHRRAIDVHAWDAGPRRR
jgi:hypothetical protein